MSFSSIPYVIVSKSDIPDFVNPTKEDIAEARFMRATLHFIKEVKQFHNEEVAKRLIDKATEALGKEWSTKMIYSIVSGQQHLGEDEYIIQVAMGHHELSTGTAMRTAGKIERIKFIRTITGCGLKEAKDAYELFVDQTFSWTNNRTIFDIQPRLILTWKKNVSYAHFENIDLETNKVDLVRI